MTFSTKGLICYFRRPFGFVLFFCPHGEEIDVPCYRHMADYATGNGAAKCRKKRKKKKKTPTCRDKASPECLNT